MEGRLTPADLVGRFSGRDRFAVPVWASKITAFIDIQQSVLYGMVCAWRPEDFTGTVIYYGTWPEQPGRRYFTLSEIQHTIQDAFPNMGLEAQIRKALAAYEVVLLGRDWRREDGISLKADRLLIDSGFKMDEVFEHCRTSPYSGVAMPSRGQPIGAKQKPMHEAKASPGDRKGLHWFIGPQKSGNRILRWCRIDTNFWKSFLVERMRQDTKDAGALTFYGRTRQDADHDMLADHLTCEYGVEVEASGRKITEWSAPPNAQNHWLDCLVGCAVAASVEGAVLPGLVVGKQKTKRINIAEMQRQAQAKRG
jgi:phage terminase large subunit GpA-like protein